MPIVRYAASTFDGGLGTPFGWLGRGGGSYVGGKSSGRAGAFIGSLVGDVAGYNTGRFFNDPRSQIGGHSPVYWYSTQIWHAQGSQR